MDKTIITYTTYTHLGWADRFRVLYHGNVDVISGIEVEAGEVILSGKDTNTTIVKKIFK